MYTVNARGKYYEMGYHHGLLLKQSGFTLPPPEEKMVQFAQQCESIVGQYMPELLEEVRGVAEGAAIDYNTLMTLTMTAPFDADEIPSCSIVAVMPERSRNGKMLVGRNFDMYYHVSQEGATIYCTYPEGQNASIGTCDIWVGRWDGLNEAGLLTATAALFMPGPSPALPGPVGWFPGRYILDTCATVEEALTFIEDLPRTGSGARLIADKSDAVALEASVHGIELRYPEDGLLIVTNHAVSPQFAGKESHVPESSHLRYDRLLELLRGNNSITIKDIKKGLSDHKGGVCAHETDESGHPFGTIWSVVGHPGERHVYIAEGHPCKTIYRRVIL